MNRDVRRQLEPSPTDAPDGFAGALTGVYSDFDLNALRDEWAERSPSEVETQLRA